MSMLIYSPNNKNPRSAERGFCFLVGHLRFQFLGLVDHLLNLSHCRNTSADVELSIDFLKLWLQVLCYTMTELLDCVYTSLLE